MAEAQARAAGDAPVGEALADKGRDVGESSLSHMSSLKPAKPEAEMPLARRLAEATWGVEPESLTAAPPASPATPATTTASATGGFDDGPSSGGPPGHSSSSSSSVPPDDGSLGAGATVAPTKQLGADEEEASGSDPATAADPRLRRLPSWCDQWCALSVWVRAAMRGVWVV